MMTHSYLRKIALFLFYLIVTLPLSSCYHTSSPQRLTILHTNDHHGRFWQNEYGEYGLSAQKSLIDTIRQQVKQQGGSLLLLSGGDINTGVPESDLLNAEPDFKGMQLIGYDAMAVGNHEFDHPLSVIRQQQSWVNFPFLSANIYEKGSNKRLFPPYKTFKRNGLTITVFGLTTDDTAILAAPFNTQGVEFRPTIPEAKAIIQEIQQREHPDIIIAVTHMGHYPNGEHGTMALGDVTLARNLAPGSLTMIVGGHSQNPVCMANSNQRIENYLPGMPCLPDKQNGIWIVQAHEWGKYVGRADFVYQKGQWQLEHYQLIPINLRLTNNDVAHAMPPKIKEDSDMLALLTPYQQKSQIQLAKRVGMLADEFIGHREVVRYQQTPLAQLILSAFIDYTDADIGIMSGGMIRDSLPKGVITYRDILKVEPFNNKVVSFTLSGEQLLNYLSTAYSKSVGSGGFLHVRQVTLTTQGKRVMHATIKGKPLDKKATYRIATLDFLAAGGDGYPKVTSLPSYHNSNVADAVILSRYITKHSPIKTLNYRPEN